MESDNQSKPDPTEKAARVLLQHLGYHDILFEPNGYKVPPDFCIEGNIGVEVTRLERHFQTERGLLPIESVEKPVEYLLKEWLISLPDHKLDCTVWVQLLFEREGGLDLNPDKALLLKHIESATMEGDFMRRTQVNDKLEFQLLKSARKGKFPYMVHPSAGGSGYMIDEYRLNALRKAIAHKSSKVDKIKDDYSALWLILEDRVAISVEVTGLAELDLSAGKHPFSRIILFSWQKPEEWIELKV